MEARPNQVIRTYHSDRWMCGCERSAEQRECSGDELVVKIESQTVLIDATLLLQLETNTLSIHTHATRAQLPKPPFFNQIGPRRDALHVTLSFTTLTNGLQSGEARAGRNSDPSEEEV